MSTTKEVTIQLNEVRALLAFASSDRTRYVLCGIQCESRPGKAPLLIATNGIILGLVSSSAGLCSATEPFNVLLVARSLRALLKLATKQDSLVTVTVSKKTITMALPASERSFTDKNEGWAWTFPQWRQVLPAKSDARPHHAVNVNAEYLLAFAGAAKLLRPSSKVNPTLQLHAADELAAIQVKCDKVPNFYGVLMPCRVDGEAEFQPAWVAAEAAAIPAPAAATETKAA